MGVIVVVALLVCRWASAVAAVAGAMADLFFGGHRGMAVVLAGASKAS